MAYTEADAEKAIRESCATPEGADAALGMFRACVDRGLTVPQAAERVLLTLIDLKEGGSGDPAASVRRHLGREPKGPAEESKL